MNAGGPSKGSPYDYQPEWRWYNTLWEMRDKSFRHWYYTSKKRDFKIYWKYQSYQVAEKAFFGFLIGSLIVFIVTNDTSLAILRWPTEDPNELLKSPVWQKKRNEINKRKEDASKLLEDSNYIHNKNTSVPTS
ncbi:hypothetical protein, conserved [Angomonas deanei]|uniref:Uncharacterized protein n=1 Tax=Angomonas deanei TaxID=59799 RepID=A0A7G2CQD3_9TRYP|nr:hypothetical protein, conserved [Angomonas deanei]